MMKNYPLSIEEVWDKQFELREALEEEYGLVNFNNYPLFLDGLYMGHFNSISGEALKIKKLYNLCKKEFKCYYRRSYDKPSEANIIFPYNVTVEVYDKIVLK
jgi:hypothetical protein